MPFAASSNLMWNGPASAAMLEDAGTIGIELAIKGFARINQEVQISLPAANLKATRLRNSPVEATGSGELVLALPKGRARPSLSVSIGAIPSAFDIAQAVWLQNIAAVNVSGTTGQKLNAAGGSADPWSADLSTYTTGQAGHLLNSRVDAAISTRATQSSVDSLPTAETVSTELLDSSDVETGVTFREALRIVLAALAGGISGAGTNTITIRDVNDTKDRIVATVDENGNRTSVTIDGS